MACNCSKNRAATAGAAGATPGTHRVMVGEPGAQRQVYESTSREAATTVAQRFANATVLAPGETA